MNRKLLQLLRDNAQARAEGAPAIRVDATSDTVAHVYLYDVIDSWFGVSAASLINALQAAGDREVHLHINSPGGDVFEGLAMSAAIAAHPSPIVGHIDGLAASAATGVALACASLSMSDGGLFMVHNSWTITMGDKASLLQTASLLDKVDQGIAQTYVRATGKTLDEVVGWMDAETWFTAAEALDAGFIDSVVEPTQRAQATAKAAAWDLAAYANAPKLAAFDQPAANDTAIAAEAAALQLRNRNRLRLVNQI